MEDKSKVGLMVSLSIKVGLVMMMMSFVLKAFFFSSVANLLLTPVIMGIAWFGLTFFFLKIIEQYSNEIFALLIPTSSDNKRGNKSYSDIFNKGSGIYGETTAQTHVDSTREQYENEYQGLYGDIGDSNKIDMSELNETSTSPVLEPRKLRGKEVSGKKEVTVEDFKSSSAEEIAKAVQSMLKKD